MQQLKIGDLRIGERHPTYRLPDGSTWTKLTATLHAPAELRHGEWHCAGEVVGLDPNQVVAEVLDGEELVH